MPNFNFTFWALILQIPAAFCVLTLHEMVKARCSDWLGDPTPKKSGLMSGNPFKYLEPIGFAMAVIFGFGWGRPTQTSPLYYKDRQKGILITYLTPSLVNLFVGLAAALIIGVLNSNSAVIEVLLHANQIVNVAVSWLFSFMHTFARVSVGTALFNMIPVPPLDAAKLLQSVLSPNAAVKITQNEKIMQLVLIMLILMGVISGVINPIVHMLVSAALFW